MKLRRLSLLFVLFLLGLIVMEVNAGASLDYGSVPGEPPVGQVNWLAWQDKNIQAGGYPSEVLTEDQMNSDLGVDQGYQVFGGGPKWLLAVQNFSNSANNDAVTILLGGLGASSGNGWRDSFIWDVGVSTTDQGEATAEASFNACPLMTQGSWNGTQKVINWTGPAGKYHIYRSTQGSGAGNGASNGRYQFIATVTTTGSSGTYTDNVDVDSWHLVIPADASGAINGCHSEESNPTAVSLHNFHARSGGENSLFLKGLIGIGLLSVATLILILSRRRMMMD